MSGAVNPLSLLRLIPNISPTQADLLIRDTVSLGVLALLTAGIELPVLAQDVEFVTSNEAEESDIDSQDHAEAGVKVRWRRPEVGRPRVGRSTDRVDQSETRSTLGVRTSDVQ